MGFFGNIFGNGKGGPIPPAPQPASQPHGRADSVMTYQRLATWYLTRGNPVRDLTPATLVSALDAYYAGQLRRMALLMERIEDVDDVLKVVAVKAKKQPGTRGWEILTDDDSPEAAAQKEALEDFYNRLTVTSAIDLDERGEVSLLLRQMMDAKSKGIACHEILWQPQPGYLTAELRFVPLWFFERTQGRLRFLQADQDTYGVDLAPGRWLITHGDGLMRACAIAYLYKQMPLKDWLIYCGRHGMPGLIGKTDATYASAEWQAMQTAVSQFSSDFAAVVSANASIEVIDATAKGELPHPKIVERMDRTMAAIWRGADLSTMSSGAGDGTGASLQGDEAEIIASADAESLADTLRRTIDRVVIKWATGSDKPLAYFAIKGVTQDTTELDLKVDETLHRMGFPTSQEALAARYGRALPDDAETVLPPPQAAPGATMPAFTPAAQAGTPAAPATPTPTDGAETVQDLALNGAQIQSLLSLVKELSTKQIPAETAKAMLGAAFPSISQERIDAMIAPLATFTPALAANAAPPTPADAFRAASRERLAQGLQADAAPLARELNDILILAEAEQWDPDRVLNALADLDRRLPELQKAMNIDPESAAAFADVLASAISTAAGDAAAQLEATP